MMGVGERLVVVDYGGQYTHLIARRCRELGVYAEIVPQNTNLMTPSSMPIKGVILSGGPRTATKEDLEGVFSDNMKLFRSEGIPVLGICFGHQLLALAVGGTVESGGNPEYGSIPITVSSTDSILNDIENNQRVWMSHSDQVVSLPAHTRVLATSKEGHIAAFEDTEQSIIG
ncbi:MAG: gamma-glutamyl-gamma-aminobutyrate hydrolase family protein, partial [Candidatus Thorarchaeota archaeon]